MGYIEKLPRHEQDKMLAVAVFNCVLADLEQGRWAYDDWSRTGMVEALKWLTAGRYPLANVEARGALTPVEDRSKQAFEAAPLVSLQYLRDSLNAVIAAPAQEFPTF